MSQPEKIGRGTKLGRMARKQKGLCAYCKQPMTREYGQPNTMTRDHVIPRSRGGTNRNENLVAACYTCNNLKGDDLPGVLRQKLKEKATWPVTTKPTTPPSSSASASTTSTPAGSRIAGTSCRAAS